MGGASYDAEADRQRYRVVDEGRLDGVAGPLGDRGAVACVRLGQDDGKFLATDARTAFTLEAWVNPRAITPWDMIFLKEAPGSLAYGLYADSGGGNSPPSGWVAENGTYATTRLPLNTWTHLAIAYENNTARLYVNGTLVSTDPYVPATTASTGPLRIGGNAIWTDEFLDGRIDEIRIYDRALTTTQITTDMNTAVNR